MIQKHNMNESNCISTTPLLDYLNKLIISLRSQDTKSRTSPKFGSRVWLTPPPFDHGGQIFIHHNRILHKNRFLSEHDLPYHHCLDHVLVYILRDHHCYYKKNYKCI